ncbi:MAG: hypothetical protein ACRDTM_02370 [Micromonosporaceae bacterium]
MQTAGWDPVRGHWVTPPHGYGYRQLPGYGYPYRQPARPTYREPHPIRTLPVAAGIGTTTVWFLFFGLLGWNARSYAWSTIVAGVLAFLVAAALNRYGDRGVALGVAVTSAIGVSIAGLVVGIAHYGGDWILW